MKQIVPERFASLAKELAHQEVERKAIRLWNPTRLSKLKDDHRRVHLRRRIEGTGGNIESDLDIIVRLGEQREGRPVFRPFLGAYPLCYFLLHGKDHPLGPAISFKKSSDQGRAYVIGKVSAQIPGGASFFESRKKGLESISFDEGKTGLVTERPSAQDSAKPVIQFKGGKERPPLKKDGGNRSNPRPHFPYVLPRLHIEQIDDPRPARIRDEKVLSKLPAHRQPLLLQEGCNRVG